MTALRALLARIGELAPYGVLAAIAAVIALLLSPATGTRSIVGTLLAGALVGMIASGVALERGVGPWMSAAYGAAFGLAGSGLARAVVGVGNAIAARPLQWLAVLLRRPLPDEPPSLDDTTPEVPRGRRRVPPRGRREGG